MPRGLSLPVAILLVPLSVFAFALAFPPFGVRPLAFVCLVPLFLAIRSGGLGRAAWLGLLWGLLMAWTIASVFPGSIARYYERPPWFGFVAGNVIFLVMAAVYYAVFSVVDRRLLRRRSLFAPLLVAAAWVAMELARGRLFTGTPFFIGNPWGLLGYTHASGGLAQIASVTGVYGVSFVLVAVNAGIAEAWMRWRAKGAHRHVVALLVISALPAITAATVGALMLGSVQAPGIASGGRPVTVVQGNVSIDRRWRSDFHAKNLDVYLALTRAALREHAPELVVWPENAMNFFVEAEPRYRSAIQATLGAGAASLLAGGPSAEGDRTPPFYNSVFLIEAENGVAARYDKEYLVPFSEYFPAASLDWMQRVLEGARTFESGPRDPPPLDSPIGRLGILICNEAMLPEVARARVLAGAELLVSPSNDSWIAGRAFAEHMLAVVSLRAIEQRRYLIRSSTSGPSAIIDPYGRVVARTDAFARQSLSADVHAVRNSSPYARLGDAFGAGCVLVMLGALVASGPRRSAWDLPPPAHS